MGASNDDIGNHRMQLQTLSRLSLLLSNIPSLSLADSDSLFSIPLSPLSTLLRLAQRSDRIIHRLDDRKPLQRNVHLVNGCILAPTVPARCHVRSLRRRHLRGLDIGTDQGAISTGAMHAAAD